MKTTSREMQGKGQNRENVNQEVNGLADKNEMNEKILAGLGY